MRTYESSARHPIPDRARMSPRRWLARTSSTSRAQRPAVDRRYRATVPLGLKFSGSISRHTASPNVAIDRHTNRELHTRMNPLIPLASQPSDIGLGLCCPRSRALPARSDHAVFPPTGPVGQSGSARPSTDSLVAPMAPEHRFALDADDHTEQVVVEDGGIASRARSIWSSNHIWAPIPFTGGDSTVTEKIPRCATDDDVTDGNLGRSARPDAQSSPGRMVGYMHVP